MTPTQVQHTLAVIGKMFPRNALTQDELQLFGEAIVRIDIDEEQAEAVIKAYRLNAAKYSNPDFGQLLPLLKAAYQPKPEQQRAPGRNLLVDVYRLPKRFNLPGHYTDQQVAQHVARAVVAPRGVNGARLHYREMMMEFMTDDIAVWKLVFEEFPDEAMQAKIRELVKRKRAAERERDKRLEAAGKQEATQ